MACFIAISFRVELQRDRVGCKCCLCGGLGKGGGVLFQPDSVSSE